MRKICIGLLICLSFCMQSCDGFRELRLEINFRNELSDDEYSKAVYLVDNFLKDNAFKCATYEVDVSRRHCSFDAIHLVSGLDGKNETFSIELYEFGPAVPTKQYQLLCKELSELVRTNFKEQSVTLNPKRSGL